MNTTHNHSGFYAKNRKALLDKLPENSLVLISANAHIPKSADQTYPFCQNKDFYYLTGLNQENSILCLSKGHPDPAMREVLFLLNPSPELKIWTGHRYTKDEARQISGIQTIFHLEEFDVLVKEQMIYAKEVYMLGNESPKFVTEYPTANDLLIKKMQQAYPLHRFQRIAPILSEMRLVKKSFELKQIMKAIEITHKMLLKAMQTIRPGLFEYQIVAEMTREMLWHGATSHAFEPIVASGRNACILHYVTCGDKMQKDDLVLMDFGADYQYYASDCSRTVPVSGSFTSRQKQCYNAVLKVFKKAKKLYVPGNTIHIINQKVNKWLEEEMIALGLFTKQDVKNQNPESPLFKKYFMHGTAHFVGLDVHDYGLKHVPLKKNMILTCEPGLYIPEENIGIRIENMILVDDKPVDLMKHFPIEADEIEALMKNLSKKK